MADGIDRMAAPLRAELAGSWIRLVVLRAWLAGLEPIEFERLRHRVADVVDTATDLGQVGMMLSVRLMIEAMTEDEDEGWGRITPSRWSGDRPPFGPRLGSGNAPGFSR